MERQMSYFQNFNGPAGKKAKRKGPEEDKPIMHTKSASAIAALRALYVNQSNEERNAVSTIVNLFNEQKEELRRLKPFEESYMRQTNELLRLQQLCKDLEAKNCELREEKDALVAYIGENCPFYEYDPEDDPEHFLYKGSTYFEDDPDGGDNDPYELEQDI